jgi:hypothetical protein
VRRLLALGVVLAFCGCSHGPKPTADSAQPAASGAAEAAPAAGSSPEPAPAKKANHKSKPKTVAAKPTPPPAAPPPEPNAGVVAGSSTSAPVDTTVARPEVVPQLSADERRELEKSSREQIDAARTKLSALDAAKLDADKQRKLLIAQGFLADAIAARTQQDWMRASQLATKAKVLADELSTN